MLEISEFIVLVLTLVLTGVLVYLGHQGNRSITDIADMVRQRVKA